MYEVYEALTNIGMAFLMIIFFMYNEDIAIKHEVRSWKIMGILFTPLVQFLLIGYSVHQKKVEEQGEIAKDF